MFLQVLNLHLCIFVHNLCSQIRIDMTKFTTKHDAVVFILKEAIDMYGYNMTDLESITGITRSQLYRWLNGDAKNIQQKSFQAVSTKLGYDIEKHSDGFDLIHHKPNTGDDMESYTIEAQSKTIKLQEEKIERLDNDIQKLKNIVKAQKSLKNKPAYHFKSKSDYDHTTGIYTNVQIEGDVSMTGFTIDELCNLTTEEWMKMYHPKSFEQLLSSIPEEIPSFSHNIWNHIYWAAKDGAYKMYNIESYHSKEEGVVRAYYYWVNGDIEGKS